MRVAPQTLAQKIIARAAGRAAVVPGEIVTCKVDLAMFHDSSGPRRLQPMLERLGAPVWDPERVVLVTDHYLPAADEESRNILRITRDWARTAGIRNFHDGIGICHVVLAERGHLRPGMFAVGGDSHSPTGGAFGAYMFGIGATEMVGVLVTGEIWLRVPHTLRMEWNGHFAPGVTAKDVMLFLCTRFGLDGGQYQAVEYAGSAIRTLPMQERMTLANMTAELGGQTGLIAPDEITFRYLEAADGAGGARTASGAARAQYASAAGNGRDAASAVAHAGGFESWQSDAGAPLLAHHEFDAAALVPQVAAPFSPALARPATEFANTRVDVAYIGACTGAKLEDLRMAARVLRGRKTAPGVEFLVAPASLRDQEAARAEGTLGVLEAAGARLFATACGACAGYGNRLGPNQNVISSTARNFKGRMGDPTAEVYLGSPFTVAASAVAGRIVDPREFLQ